MPRTYHYAEALTRATTTTTDLSAVAVGLTFTPKASTTYALFWNTVVDCSSLYDTVTVRLYNQTSSSTLHTAYWAATRTLEYHPLGGFAIYTSGASPTSTTFQLQYGMYAAGQTAGAADSTLIAVELTANDQYVESLGVSTNATTTYSNKTTLSWTPGSAADYLVCASAALATDNSGAGPKIRINYNSGTIYAEHNPYDYGGSSTQSLLPFFFIKQGASLSGAQSFAIEFGLAWGTGTMSCQNARVLALYMPDFYGYYWDEDRTANNSTSATYATSGISITQTPEAQTYWILAGGMSTSDDTTRAVLESNIVRRNSTSLFTNAPAQCSYSANEQPWVFSRAASESASSTTWDHQYASLSGTGTAIVSDNALAVMKMTSVATSTSAIPPDSIAASTNLTGAYTDIDEDPDSQDANWLTASSTSSATDLRVTFGSPAGTPYGAQNFRTLLRTTAASTSPTVDISLYQNGSSVATLVTGQAITSTSGQVVQADWTASQLTGTVDGSDVECRVVSTPVSSGGLPAYSSSGTATSSTAIGSKTIAVPAHAAGDLLLLTVLARNAAANATVTQITTAGWTQLGGTGNMYGGTQLGRIAVGWKIGNGSESTVAFDMSGTATTVRVIARVHRFTSSGAGFSSTAVQNVSSASTGSSTSVAMPTVVPSGTNQLAVAVCVNSASGSIGPSTGESGGDWTEPVTETSATNGLLQIQASDQSGGGTISGGTSTLSISGQWVSLGFTLVPATGATVEVGAIEWNAQYLTPTGYNIPAAAFSAHAYAPGASYKYTVPVAASAAHAYAPSATYKAPVPVSHVAPHAYAPSLRALYNVPTASAAFTARVPSALFRYTTPASAVAAHAFAPSVTYKAQIPAAHVSPHANAPAVSARYNVPVAAATFIGRIPSARLSYTSAQASATLTARIPGVGQQIPASHIAPHVNVPTLRANAHAPAATLNAHGNAPSAVMRVSVPVAHATFTAVTPAQGANALDIPAAHLSFIPHVPSVQQSGLALPGAAFSASTHQPSVGAQNVHVPAASVSTHPLAPSVRSIAHVPTCAASAHAYAPAIGQQVGALHLSFSVNAPLLGIGSIEMPGAAAVATARTPVIGQQAPTAHVAEHPVAPSLGPWRVAIPRLSSSAVAYAPDIPPPPDVTPTAGAVAHAFAPSVGAQLIRVPTSAAAAATSPSAAMRLAYNSGVAHCAYTAPIPVARQYVHVPYRSAIFTARQPSALVTTPEFSIPAHVVRAQRMITVDAPRGMFHVSGFTIPVDEI